MRALLLLLPAVLLVSGCNLLPTKKLSLGLGSDSSEENSRDEAEDEVKKIVDSVETPSIELTLYKSAQEAEASGDLTKAGYYYEQLTQRYPKNAKYNFHFAEIQRRLGHCKEAGVIYDRLLASDKDNIDYQEAKALCLLADTKFKEAGEIFTRIIKADGNRWKSINGAGLIFAASNKYQEANQYFDLAADVSNSNPAVLNNQALLKALIGNTQDAIAILKDASFRAMGDGTQKRQVDLNLALVYAIAGKLDMAEQTARPVLTEPQLYNNMGVYAQLAKDQELAKTYLNKALMGTPVHYEKAWDNLERLEKR